MTMMMMMIEESVDKIYFCLNVNFLLRTKLPTNTPWPAELVGAGLTAAED